MLCLVKCGQEPPAPDPVTLAVDPRLPGGYDTYIHRYDAFQVKHNVCRDI